MRILVIFLTLISFIACSEVPVENSETTTIPQIVKISVDKDTINFGGGDPAIITCEAKGGNLEFTWEVDLGDIFPLKNDNSKVRFSGSPCCIGKKIIKCTVANDKGNATRNVEIFIREPK